MRKKIITIILLSIVLIALIALCVYFARMTQSDGILTVVLDPGHGGNDPGAVAGEIFEKEINLSVALLVRDILEEHENVAVKMTRTDDEFISLSQRAQYANKENPDLYVSIHANTLEDKSYSGIMTFHHPDKTDGKQPAKMIQKALIEATGAVDRNMRTERYMVLQETEMPAALVEMGFMTNDAELDLLTDPNYQQKIAEGIANGILAFDGR